MAYKINRRVMIDGSSKWIHANSEQEYAQKVLELGNKNGGSTEKHNFRDYAMNWFELYCKPNICTITQIAYQRQLDLYLLPAFSKFYGMPLDAILAMGTEVNPLAKEGSIVSFVVACVAPMNLIKGTLVSVVTLLIYKPLSPIIKTGHKA